MEGGKGETEEKKKKKPENRLTLLFCSNIIKFQSPKKLG